MNPASEIAAAAELWAIGDHAGAALKAKAVLAKFPVHSQANEMVAAHESELGRWEEARSYLTKAIEGDPKSPHLWYALGCATGQVGNVAGAADAFRRSLMHDPAFDAAVPALAMALVELGLSSEAEQVLRRGLARHPSDVLLASALAMVLADRGKPEQATALMRHLLALAPMDHDLLTLVRQWLNYVDESGLGEAVELRERHARLLGPAPGWPRSGGRAFLDPDRPLRVGYLSPDLRRHSVSYFVEPLLAHPESVAFETVCYSTDPRADLVTARLQSQAGGWRECSRMSDVDLAEMIRRDRIDILVELSGLTTGNRLAALSRRCAPVQVTYLGCPSSTGIPAIDYRLVDVVTDPPGAERNASERLERIPGCFVCYRPPEEAPDVAPPPSLAGAPLSFGSFNSLGKLSPRTVRLWADVLAAVPGSVLVLKGKGLGDPAGRQSVEEMFGQAGLKADRLRLLGDIPVLKDHLAAYSQVDIALDPVPYNGTTTTCEALWMGVPVLSVPGKLHAGRVGASLLTAVGHPEWIADSPEGLIDLAKSLAADRPGLATIRANLREQMRASRLCDATTHSRELDACYRRMWRAWVSASKN